MKSKLVVYHPPYTSINSKYIKRKVQVLEENTGEYFIFECKNLFKLTKAEAMKINSLYKV